MVRSLTQFLKALTISPPEDLARHEEGLRLAGALERTSSACDGAGSERVAVDRTRNGAGSTSGFDPKPTLPIRDKQYQKMVACFVSEAWVAQ
jgi:hypothetical protein